MAYIMTAEHKKKISEALRGVKRGAARGALAVLPKNDVTRQKIVGGVAGAVVGAASLGIYNGASMAGLGGAIGAINKKLIGISHGKEIANKAAKVGSALVSYKKDHFTGKGNIVPYSKVNDAVTAARSLNASGRYKAQAVLVGAKSGAKVFGKSGLVAGAVVGGVVGGVSGATDKNFRRKVDNHLRKAAK
jgi:hypothetical protein